MAFTDYLSAKPPETIHTQVCIIGAGAAGITIARNLKNSERVTLVDSGNFGLDNRTQSLYEGKNLALKYFDLLKCRLRYFGGTTNHWGGYCRTNDPIDYEGRPDLNLPEWPVKSDELEPYIERAKKELGLKYDFFDHTELLKDKGISKDQLIDDITDGLQTKIFQVSSKTKFSRIYRDELKKQSNLDVLLNLNAVHIELSTDGLNIEFILLRNLKGEETRIYAQKFIIACHGIENARLLLNSNNRQKQGIGNTSGHVGKYFMEHAHIDASRLIPTDNFPKFYDFSLLRRQKLNANISFTDEFTRKNKMLQYYCRFFPVYAEDSVLNAARRLKQSLNQPYSASLYYDLSKSVSNIQEITKFVISNLHWHSPTPKYYYLNHRIEQAPNPNSRVVISSEKDEVGAYKADLNWELNNHDYDAFKKGQDKIVMELSALNAGRFELEEITPSLVKQRLKGHYHHTGTTRMSENIDSGVVDKNCKVHGINNLYIAGSSVFPTAGYSGPTLVILALSYRLAEHIESISPKRT
jgi:choline dehydrogenase-like flavoprotein